MRHDEYAVHDALSLADKPCAYSSRSLRDCVPNHKPELVASYRTAGAAAH